MEQVNLMTLEEFSREYDKAPFELVNGERRPIYPKVAIHQWIVRETFRLLYPFCADNKLGEVFFSGPFVELYSSQWVKGSRTPDLMFFSAAKWAQYTTQMEDWQGKPFVMIPDLAVEVVSPNDSYGELEEKVDEYVAKGVSLIWLIDPQRRRVRVYQNGQEIRLGENDTLTGGDLLPGLEIKLADLFKQL
jgi:Uma2 family endonuclease